MATPEQIKQYKLALRNRMKENRRLKSLFHTIMRIALKKDIFNGFISEAYSIFSLDYKIQNLFVEVAPQSGQYKKQTIGYFLLKDNSPQTFKTHMTNMISFYMRVLEGIVKEQCMAKNINPTIVLQSNLFGQTFHYWLQHFSTAIVSEIATLINTYNDKVIYYYNESFEYRGDKLVLKDGTDFLRNEEKKKLFREYYYSTAENYYTSELSKGVKESFKENMIDKYSEFFEKEFDKLETALANAG